MIDTFILLAGAILRLFPCRRRLLLENLALRQQLAALKRRHPRPRLAAFDKVFWVLAQKFWSGWKQDSQCRESRDGWALAQIWIRTLLGVPFPRSAKHPAEKELQRKCAI